MPGSPSKRPRRKAKQERSRQTVQALLEAAARVLEVHGYAAATTNRIAECAGASVGTLYEYFPNKEAIYEALIELEIARLVAAVQRTDIDPGAPLHDTLRRVLLSAMAAIRHGPDFIRSLEQVPGAVFRRHLAGARQSVIGFVRQLLEVRRQEVRVTDLDLAAFIVVSAAEGIGANVSEDRFDDRLAEEVATLVTLYLTGKNPRAGATLAAGASA
jgi:AcrR family transcriptional regulator